MIQSPRASLLPAAILFLAACAAPAAYQTVPMPDQTVDLEQASNTRFYILREEQTLWRRFPLKVYIADEEIGSLAPGTYMCWERGPGRVLARLILERSRAEGGPIEHLYDTRIEGGTVHWVQVGVDTDDQRLITTSVEAAEGAALVAELEAAAVR